MSFGSARATQRLPALRLLATSRAPLRFTAEAQFPLRPLWLPAPGTVPSLEDLETYEAVELFLDRTRRAAAGASPP